MESPCLVLCRLALFLIGKFLFQPAFGAFASDAFEKAERFGCCFWPLAFNDAIVELARPDRTVGFAMSQSPFISVSQCVVHVADMLLEV